jgi:hypothetical protein
LEPPIHAAADRLLTAPEVAELVGVSILNALRRQWAGAPPGFGLHADRQPPYPDAGDLPTGRQAEVEVVAT